MMSLIKAYHEYDSHKNNFFSTAYAFHRQFRCLTDKLNVLPIECNFRCNLKQISRRQDGAISVSSVLSRPSIQVQCLKKRREEKKRRNKEMKIRERKELE